MSRCMTKPTKMTFAPSEDSDQPRHMSFCWFCHALNILLSMYMTHTVFNSIFNRTKPSGYFSSLFEHIQLEMF